MKLQRRNCDIEMKLVPYGGGWTDVYLNIENDKHYFIISSSLGDQFNDFITLLYHMHPDNIGDELYDGVYDFNMEYKIAACKKINGEWKADKIVDNLDEVPDYSLFYNMPWKAKFCWDEEGAVSNWELERIPNEDKDFELQIRIEHNDKKYHYNVVYSDFCYAVAKACTETLKKHGFTGYNRATYIQDLNIRELLFLKAIALKCLDAIEITYYNEKGQGETSDFSKELELLLFDM